MIFLFMFYFISFIYLFLFAVTIDVGTNNQNLLNDEYYMGLRHPRIEGAEYFEIMDEFMQAVYMRYPRALVQFEVSLLGYTVSFRYCT